MKIFGWRIVQEKGTILGPHEPAILNLQKRVSVLEHNQVVKVLEVKEEVHHQSEIEKILSAKGEAPAGGLWEGL